MRTVYASLPFYDSLAKQDRTRTGAIMPIHCPRHQLPPFLINAGTETIIPFYNENVVVNGTFDYDGDWNLGVGWSIIIGPPNYLLGSVVTGGSNSWQNCVKIGKSYRVSYDVNISNGSMRVVVGGRTGITRSGSGHYEEDFYTMLDVVLMFQCVDDPSTVSIDNVIARAIPLGEVLLVACDGTETDITSYFVDLPELITVGTDTYIQYDGAMLNTILPTGSYYIKLSNQDIIYYSDWIRVSNIYPNLADPLRVGYSNYDVLTLSRSTIVSAIDAGGSGSVRSKNDFPVAKGDIITFVGYLIVTGDPPDVRILILGGANISNVETLSAGLNVKTLTVTKSAPEAVVFIETVGATNYSLTCNFFRSYSPNFMKLSFSNTNDLGDILYSTTYSQEVWLEAKLNNPTHEVVEIGDEKDGIFIAEKIVTKFIYRIIAYISRGLYNCLIRMPQSDSIIITDEVGTTYTPSVGNVIIEPVDWVTYETGKVVISFNDGENSAFKWTNNMDNL